MQAFLLNLLLLPEICEKSANRQGISSCVNASLRPCSSLSPSERRVSGADVCPVYSTRQFELPRACRRGKKAKQMSRKLKGKNPMAEGRRARRYAA